MGDRLVGGPLKADVRIRPFKIDCMFCVRIFQKILRASAKTKHTEKMQLDVEESSLFMVNCCVCF